MSHSGSLRSGSHDSADGPSRAGLSGRRAHDLAAALLPPVGRLRAQRDALAEERDRLLAECYGGDGRPPLYPPGHFHSPIPDLDEVRRHEDVLFRLPRSLPGIDLRMKEQFALVSRLRDTWADWPYSGDTAGLRYRPHNDYFGHVDGLVLFGLLRLLRPRRYLEVGGGWSTALAVDVRERHLKDLQITSVEPYPDRLLALLHRGDEPTLIRHPVQEVDVETFQQLEAGDVLFIDSTHVSKIGSDVNYLMFEVLPRVAPGVWIHVHDIRYPFEYSAEWVYEGRAWNEAYVLRALLTESPVWQIELWASCLQLLCPEEFRRLLPAETTMNGSSIWLRHR